MHGKFVGLSVAPALCGPFATPSAQVLGQGAAKETEKPIETSVAVDGVEPDAMEPLKTIGGYLAGPRSIIDAAATIKERLVQVAHHLDNELPLHRKPFHGNHIAHVEVPNPQ